MGDRIRPTGSNRAKKAKLREMMMQSTTAAASPLQLGSSSVAPTPLQLVSEQYADVDDDVTEDEEQGSQGEGSGEQGSQEQGSQGQGSGDQGSQEQGSQGQGSGDQSDVPRSVAGVRRGRMGRFERYSSAESSTSEVSGRRDRDMSWIIRSAVPGGPIITDTLPSFGGHYAAFLWSITDPLQDRGVLRGQTRERGLSQLQLWQLSDRARELVEGTGLRHLSSCMMMHIDFPLVSAFIERWQPDTNTFHMPFGEITILLHDMAEILALPIGGDICSTTDPDTTEAHVAHMCELLGLQPNDIQSRVGTPIYRGAGVLSEALIRQTSTGMPERQARGYLMYLLGSTLFVDKSGDRIPTSLYSLIRDLPKVGDYAWGAATLAYLYRQLGKASRAHCRQVSGCLTLLQTWIYEHFPSLRPSGHMDREISAGEPRSLAWSTIPRRSTDIAALRRYRRMLDDMTVEEVEWTPYDRHPAGQYPESLFMGYITYLDVVEPYMADRCLRQFGYQQVVPSAILEPDSHYRPAGPPQSYSVQFSRTCTLFWRQWWYHTVVLDDVSQPAIPPWSVSEDYMEWFAARSHPRLLNPSLATCHPPVVRDRAGQRTQILSTIATRLGPVAEMTEERQVQYILSDVLPLVREYHGGHGDADDGGGRTTRGRGRGGGRRGRPRGGGREAGRSRGGV